MNEANQLKVIALELRAAGWNVVQDVPPDRFGLQIDLETLDFVATRAEAKADNLLPERLIVEVANRRRYKEKFDELTGLPQASPIVADEDEAIRRIDAISDSIEILSGHSVGFQVRFLDISTDSADARRLRAKSVTDDALSQKIERDVSSLAQVSHKQGIEKSLLVVAMWCRWLRMLSVRFPARRRTELKFADIRTIQKDLYDAGIVSIPPSKYFLMHQSITALVEGGDVEWRDLDKLEGELRLVLQHVAARLGSTPPTDLGLGRGLQGDELFERITSAVALFDREEREALSEQLDLLRATIGLPEYRQALLDFEELVPDDDRRFGLELQRLRQLTRLIPG